MFTCGDAVVKRRVGEGEGSQDHTHAVVLLEGGVRLNHAQCAGQCLLTDVILYSGILLGGYLITM